MTLIRPAEESDVLAIRDLFNEVIEEGDAFVFEKPFSVDQIENMVKKDSASFVAVVDGQIVGAYFLHPNNPGRGSHIGNAIYMVKSTARSRGVGTRLGKHSLRTAKELGFKAMQFNAVVSTNKKAMNLWKRLGFSIVGTVPKAFRNENDEYLDVYIMHRFL